MLIPSVGNQRAYFIRKSVVGHYAGMSGNKVA